MEITRIHTTGGYGRGPWAPGFSNLVRGSVEETQQRIDATEGFAFVELQSPEGTHFSMNPEAISRIEQLPGEFSPLPRHD